MRKIATLTAALAALALPATAAAENVKQTGYIVGDKAATVKLRVKVKGGHPVKVAGFRANDVIGRCDEKTIRIDLIALSPVEAQRDGDFKFRLGDGKGGILRVSGTVKSDGQSTSGNVKTNEFERGNKTCKVRKQAFKTSAGK